MSNRRRLSPASTARRDQALAEAADHARRPGTQVFFVDYAPDEIDCCWCDCDVPLGGMHDDDACPQCHSCAAWVITIMSAPQHLADYPVCEAHFADAEHFMQLLHVTSESRTYRPDLDPVGKGFVLDVCRGMVLGDPSANARLAQHMNEERVDRPQYLGRAAGDSTTGSYAGLVVPQYLTDMYAPATAALRPVADHANHHMLPAEGMSVNISRITTPSAVSLQTAELLTGGETSMDDTLLTIPVQTALGDQTISRQAVERGTGIEDLVMQDLFRRTATTLDNTMITQAVTGLMAAGQVITYTSASPTAQELWPNLAKGQSVLEQALLGVAVPDYVVMHPRRWNWFTSTLGSTWPLIGGSNIPAQSGGIVLTNEYGSGVRGILPNGLKVIVDGNIPVNLGAGTNQDAIFVIASEELHLWEDVNAPAFIRAEQTYASKLGLLLVVYEFFAYSVGRYANNPSVISGTGLVAPAGF